jgi:arginyl-tRNA--protein-N-Asp/Glu arginylyltransferase
MNQEREVSEQLMLYRSTGHPCSYLPGRSASTLFVDPGATRNPLLYSLLIEHGFRRSGEMIYRPDCDGCTDCIPVRIPVDEFKPRRIQRRIWNRGSDLFQINEQPALFDERHYRLFRRYLESRHQDGEMAGMGEEEYRRFLISDCSETSFVEFSIDGKLAAVAVADRLPQGLSAVYTFFDPDLLEHSPGVFAILWQIERCRQTNKPFLYLGYWIRDCRKMAYKGDFRPFEALVDGQWKRHEKISV